ncbi:MAG: Hsp70 family protein, partial [Blautia sp.]|nr:Hsp70 family protein [Blautia sp.]
MAEKQFYAAIDLGTTNSVIAYGNIVNDKLKPIVLELDRKNDTGSTSRNPLLPSVVFYYRNSEGNMVTDVGDYAKSRYGTRNGYVCKSVKSLMGVSDTVPLVEEISDKTPADVSAQILTYMVNASKKRLFQKELRDIIIT